MAASLLSGPVVHGSSAQQDQHGADNQQAAGDLGGDSDWPDHTDAHKDEGDAEDDHSDEHFLFPRVFAAMAEVRGAAATPF